MPEKNQSESPFHYIFRNSGSLWFAAVILILLLVAMACATVFETMYGSEQALDVFYRSWWFALLLFLLGCNVLFAMILRRPFSRRQIGFVLTHSSILLVLIGALVTKVLAIEGLLSLDEGQIASEFIIPRDVLSVNNTTYGVSEKMSSIIKGNVKFEVQSFLSDSLMVQEVFNDNPISQEALKVSFGAGGKDKSFWIFAGKEPSMFSEMIKFRKIADRIELDKFLKQADPKLSVPIEIVSYGKDDLYVKFTSRDNVEPLVHKLIIGKSVETLWNELKFTVLQKYDHARTDWSLEPVDPPRPQRQPGMLLKITTPKKTEKIWLQKYTSRSVKIDESTYEISYDQMQIPLGFDIKLNHFTVGFYPGGQQPRSYESRVTITQPSTGQSLSRVISMNHPTSFKGYTFYQFRYNQEQGRSTSVLSVSWDPGKPIVFTGYFTMMAGMLIVMITRLKRP